MELSNLSPNEGARKTKKRVGRGPGSGWGKTSARGQKGQKSRSGGGPARGFEGGQMPIHRRLPRRGFNNNFAKRFAIVSLKAIDESGLDVVDLAALVEAGLVKKTMNGLKVLGDGDLSRPVTIRAAKFSKSALEKIQAANGTAEVLDIG